MKLLISSFDLCDIWRTGNSEKRRYTYHQKNPLRQSQLDYFLISDSCLDHVSKVDILSSVWSDHSGISLHLNFITERSKGAGHWKFNGSFLANEEFILQMNSNIDIWKNLYSLIKDKRKKWELMKYEIRRICMQYGKRNTSSQNI